MASIKQRESGFWQAKIRRKGWPLQSRTFEQKAEAEKWARAIEHDMDTGVFQSASDAERTTLSDLIKRFEKEFAPHHYRVREDKKEAWRFQCARLSESLGAYSLAAIDQKIIAKFRDDRLNGGKRKAVSESTVRKELHLLSKVLSFAETECGINLPRGNPVDKIRKPKEGKGRDRRLTDKEWGKLEVQCRKSRNRHLLPAFTLAVESAMRQGELLSLRWEDVDFKNRFALLSDPEKIKNEEPRAVPLSSRAIEVLTRLPRSIDGVVFNVERMTLYHAFIAACKRAGVTNYTWHDLRHEAMSRLAERGDFSVLELAAVSGHKTLQMLKKYTHLQATKLAEKMG
ncbi:MAG: site-specific integrase [Betaproteobacteria bacterium]